MGCHDIAGLVSSAEPLVRDTFEEFRQGAEGLFTPEGARFQKIDNPLVNRDGETLVFHRMEVKEGEEKDKRWINVSFHNGKLCTWGLTPIEPYEFAYDPEKALYIAKQHGRGSLDDLRGSLYLKLG
jgi:hypothetical protein